MFLLVAKQCLKDEGPEFIISKFDTYYSVLHHANNLPLKLLSQAYDDLQKGKSLFFRHSYYYVMSNGTELCWTNVSTTVK